MSNLKLNDADYYYEQSHTDTAGFRPSKRLKVNQPGIAKLSQHQKFDLFKREVIECLFKNDIFRLEFLKTRFPNMFMSMDGMEIACNVASNDMMRWFLVHISDTRLLKLPSLCSAMFRRAYHRDDHARNYEGINMMRTIIKYQSEYKKSVSSQWSEEHLKLWDAMYIKAVNETYILSSQLNMYEVVTFLESLNIINYTVPVTIGPEYVAPQVLAGRTFTIYEYELYYFFNHCLSTKPGSPLYYAYQRRRERLIRIFELISDQIDPLKVYQPLPGDIGLQTRSFTLIDLIFSCKGDSKMLRELVNIFSDRIKPLIEQ